MKKRKRMLSILLSAALIVGTSASGFAVQEAEAQEMSIVEKTAENGIDDSEEKQEKQKTEQTEETAEKQLKDQTKNQSSEEEPEKTQEQESDVSMEDQEEVTAQSETDQENSTSSQDSRPELKLSATDLVSGDYTYTVSGNNATITGYTGTSSSISIPDTIEDYTVTGIGDYAFDGCSNIKSIQLPSRLKSIGYYAFRGTSISDITIPKTVTSCSYYYSSSDPCGPFAGAVELTTVRFEEGMETIPSYVLATGGQYASYVENVIIPSTVKKIGSYVFYNCTSLIGDESISLPSNLATIGAYAFYGCTKLAALTLPEGLIEIGGSAFEKSGLGSIVFPSTLKTIGEDSFLNCESLKKIEFTEYDSSGYNLTIGNSAFDGDINLSEVHFSKNITGIRFYIYANEEEPCEHVYENSVTKATLNQDGSIINRCGKCGKVNSVTTIPYPKTIRLSSASFVYNGKVQKPTVSVIGSDGKIIDMSNYTVSYSEESKDIGKYTVTISFRGNYSGSVNKTYTISDSTQSSSETGNTLHKVSKITLKGISKKIAAGKKIQLMADVLPENANSKSVTWTSSNTKVATVSASGVVTMKKKSGGKSVTITATATDGSGVKATYKIKSMKGVVKKIAVSGKKSVKAGKSLKLKAKIKATKKANKKLKWTSGNSKYAKVSSSGKVKTYKAGKGKKVKITAMATDGSGKKKSVTIKIK